MIQRRRGQGEFGWFTVDRPLLNVQAAWLEQLFVKNNSVGAEIVRSRLEY